ncbi:MAG: large conductance mechanosensitive channel protein MscL [Janthinobacterium lividum]
MFKGFKEFILRGNVVDLAVAVIIGASFAAITASVTADVITPFIAALVGTPDFSSLVIHMPVLHAVVPPNPLPAGYVAPGEIHIGRFLNTIINFLINAAAIYFLIVIPMKYVMSRTSKPVAAVEPVTKTCPQCLSAIPLAATRCAFCTEPVL